MARDLQIVLKVAERCNINCTYCYYFNSGNDSPFQRPAYIDEEVVRGVVRFVRDTADRIDLGQVRIVLHGGEPLMLKKSKFRGVCNILNELKSIRQATSIVTTTNAMLIDDDWLDIFQEFDIHTCVSVDGPRQYHDLERLDFNGHGTYARVIGGVQKLQAAAAAGRITEPGALCVIDQRFKGEVVYNHLVRDLGFRVVDFLIPLVMHDQHPTLEHIRSVGQFLMDAFAEWVKDDDPKIHVRIFNKYLTRMLGRAKLPPMSADQSFVIVGVGSDGTMINDDLMQVLGREIFDRNLNIRSSSIVDYFAELKQGVLAGVYESHKDCIECSWHEICRPPTLPWAGAEFRYKRDTGFRNKLVFCEALQALFQMMESYIEAAGQLRGNGSSADLMRINGSFTAVAPDHQAPL